MSFRKDYVCICLVFVAIVELVTSIPVENGKPEIVVMVSTEHSLMFPEISHQQIRSETEKDVISISTTTTTSGMRDGDTTELHNILRGSYSNGEATKIFSADNDETLPNKLKCGSTENLHKADFSASDYAIVSGMLIISLGIGKAKFTRIFFFFFTTN